ncbi:MAG: amidohydrolase family protein [Chloroflexi bacterium]|nr:amidohydrolase family protein [Chloroflexota bacterium]
MPKGAPYPVIDCDGHISEPIDLWDQYLDSRTAGRASAALRMVNHPGGGVSACVEGEFIGEASFQGGGGFGKTAAQISKAHWNPVDMHRGGFENVQRIKDMDAMGIDAAVLYPSMCLLINGVKDAELAAAMCRAFNKHLAEFCKPYKTRLFGAAMVPAQSVSFMIDVAADAALVGHKAIAVRPNAVHGRALHHKYYDRFWDAMQEVKMAVALHPAATSEVQGTFDTISSLGSDSHRMLPDALALPFDCMMTLSWLMFSGTLDRHPDVRIAVLEASGSWATMFIERLDKRVKYGGGPAGGRTPDIKSLPSEIFKRQCFVAFESEEAAMPRLADVVGDSMIWGSDYPHFDGEAPAEAIENVSRLPVEMQAKIMSGNAMRLYGIRMD